ncbi:MAG: transposase, partial [Candidatus Deianiraeaceae bacterium]
MIFHSMNCGSDIFCKNGINTGIQRYKCKKCGVNFTKNRASKPLHLKRLALELYLEGLDFRSIGRILKVSHVSIYNWIRKFGQKA